MGADSRMLPAKSSSLTVTFGSGSIVPEVTWQHRKVWRSNPDKNQDMRPRGQQLGAAEAGLPPSLKVPGPAWPPKALRMGQGFPKALPLSSWVRRDGNSSQGENAQASVSRRRDAGWG